MLNKRLLLPAAASALLLQSCFSEIESTPKISYKDVKRQNVTVTPEQEFAADFVAEPFSAWKPGRRFAVADGRVKLTYLPPAGKTRYAQPGDTLIYRGVREVPSIVGGYAAELMFTLSGSPADTLLYRPGRSAGELAEGESLVLPFLTDVEIVEKVAAKMLGRELYTRTDRWLDASGRDEVKGRKFVRVKITSVTARDENYPFLVGFRSLEKPGEGGSMLMSVTVGEGVPALRGFENLFTMSDPRGNYPQITDERWELIREGKVEQGMTRQEASLALGNPREIDRRHDQSLMYERWSYPGGVYLIFEDGLLVRFNR